MKQIKELLFALLLFVSVSAAMADVILTSPEYEFDCDTVVPHAVGSLSAITLPCASGATVTVASPAGKSSTLVAGTGVYTWTPDEGGFWSLSNSKEGTTTFTVRYSKFPGTEGEGTAASPLKIVDEAELVDLAEGGRIGDGTVFSLNGGDNLLSALLRPSAYSIVDLGGGLYRLGVKTDGTLVVSVAASFVADAVGSGPNRRGRVSGPWPGIAYTGDGWMRDASASSTLTITPPGGAAAVDVQVGTGTVSFAPDKCGEWVMSLEYGTTTLLASIMVLDGGCMLIVW